MSMLHFCIGFLSGIGLTILLKRIFSSRTVLELSKNQVVLVKGLTPPQVKQTNNIAFFGEEPVILTLKATVHPVLFQAQQSLLCSDHERVDLLCSLSVIPKTDEHTINQLFAAAHPQNILDQQWQMETLKPILQGCGSVLREESRTYWLNNSKDLRARLHQYLQGSLSSWNCDLSITKITETSDEFYNLDDPFEKQSTQQRKLLCLHNQDIDSQIVALQKQLSHLEQLDADVTSKKERLEQHEEILLRKAQQLDHLLQKLQSDIQTEIELLKATLHKDIGSMSIQFRKDLAAKGIAIPKQSQQQILQRKNQLLSELEQQKRSLLYDSKEGSPSEISPSTTNPEQG